eukprot:1392208-Prymnesium_polylepis.1
MRVDWFLCIRSLPRATASSPWGNAIPVYRPPLSKSVRPFRAVHLHGVVRWRRVRRLPIAANNVSRAR